MERTEPALIPEWLKNSTSSSGGTTASHADDISAPSVSKNNSSLNSNCHNFGRPSKSFAHWSSSGTSSGKFRSNSSSVRNQRDRQWEKDTNGCHDYSKPFLEDRWYMEAPEPQGNSPRSRLRREGLRRSQSTVPVKGVDPWTKKGVSDSISMGGKISDGAFPKISFPSGGNKVVFERDFPSLRGDERAGVPDVGRVPSPGLAPAIETLPISPSASLGEKWTSALAEVPILVGSNGSSFPSTANVASSGSTSVGLSASTGFNMADALTHGPLRAAAPPPLSVEAQRREELAIRKSRQLIPVTPSIPRALALNSSEKQRTKLEQTQPPLSAPLNHHPRGLHGKGDPSKPANPIKFHILKSMKEKNGVSSGVKDSWSTANSNKVVGCVVSPSNASGSTDANHVDCKPVLLVHEKRPTLQAQSRKEFFKLVRKKSMENSSAADSEASNSSSAHENNSNSTSSSAATALPATTNTCTADAPNQKAVTCSNHAWSDQKLAANGEMHPPSSSQSISDEEEAAFLRSLGWEENDEEDGLTEEEISAFRMNLTKYIESNPSPRLLQGTELKFMLPLDPSHKGSDISADS